MFICVLFHLCLYFCSSLFKSQILKVCKIRNKKNIIFFKNAIHTTCMETLRYFPKLGFYVYKSCSERTVVLSILNVGILHTFGEFVT